MNAAATPDSRPACAAEAALARRRPVVTVIGGPTAAGKSAAALRLARAHSGAVINADAMQVYRDLAVLTARPDTAAAADVPHHLYGILDGAERCSAARWRGLATAAIDAALRAGQAPIVVGGTGLYLAALMQGLAPVPPVPAAATADAASLHERLGGPAFHGELARRDPEMAARLRPSDRQRCIRAYAVVTASGRSLAHWQRQPVAASPYRFDVTLVIPPRADLYAACDARLPAMVAAGALDEVAALLARRLDPGLPVMKALGVRELARAVRGAWTLERAVAAAQQATRRYAKRQLTWFRHRLPEARAVSNPDDLG